MELIYRVRGILFAPETQWSRLAREPADVGGLAIYVALLAAIPALARFIGDFLIGASAPDGAVQRVSLDAGLLVAALDYAAGFVGVVVVALLINLVAPFFGAKRNYQEALKVAAYSFTPYWLLGLLLLVPGLRFITVLGIYGMFLARTGLVHVMHAKSDSALRYAMVVTLGAVGVIVGAIVGAAGLLARLHLS